MAWRSPLVCGSLLLVCSHAHATYSLLIADTKSRALGSVGTSCVGTQKVSQISGIAPGFGVIHAQAASNLQGRDRGVMMLKAGASADEIITAITAPTFDFLAATRQYGVVTLDGTSKGFTGAGNGSYAEDRQAKFGDYVTSWQGNILTSAKVLDQVQSSLTGAQGCDLPDTLMLALEAGAENGEGDSRCTPRGIPADSGFLKVVEEDGSEVISIEVTGASTGAVAELRKKFDAWRMTHPCAVQDAGVNDASVEDASAMAEPDAAQPTRDASLDAPKDAATARDASATNTTRDASSSRDASPRDEDGTVQKGDSSGCALHGRGGAGALWLLSALFLTKRRRHASCAA